jgi:hypothetical protein
MSRWGWCRRNLHGRNSFRQDLRLISNAFGNIAGISAPRERGHWWVKVEHLEVLSRRHKPETSLSKERLQLYEGQSQGVIFAFAAGGNWLFSDMAVGNFAM